MFFTVGQLAKRAQVHVETVRYYERRGLMPKPERKRSGYRVYSNEDVLRMRFIRRAQELGFSLKEISDLLSLRLDRDNACADVLKRAEAKIEEIDSKIRTLKRIQSALKKLAAACTAEATHGGCPILETLEKNGDFR